MVPADFDGDGAIDIGVYRVANPLNCNPDADPNQPPPPAGTGLINSNQFWALLSSTGSPWVFSLQCGAQDAKYTQDYDGDGKADPATFRRTNFGSGPFAYLVSLSSSGYQSFYAVTFPFLGNTVGLRGDYDGDGKADLGIVDRNASQLVFHVIQSSNGQELVVNFGLNGSDSPIYADFDGDGTSDISVFRNSSPNLQFWSILSSTGQSSVVSFGAPGDSPVVSDYDGDGVFDPAVTRAPATLGPRDFHILGSTSGYYVQQWGLGSDNDLTEFLIN